MALCVFCGEETELYIDDRPVCLKCVADLEAGKKLVRSEPDPRAEKATRKTEVK